MSTQPWETVPPSGTLDPDVTSEGTVDGATAEILVQPDLLHDGVIVKAPTAAWGGTTSGIDDPIVFLRANDGGYQGSTDALPTKNVLARLDKFGIAGVQALHVAPNASGRQYTGWSTPEAIWVNPDLECIGIVIDSFNNAPTSDYIVCRHRDGTIIFELQADGDFTAAGTIAANSGGANTQVLIGGGGIFFGSDCYILRQSVAKMQTGPAMSFHVTSELEIDGDLNHDGTKIGFYNTAPINKPTGVAVTAAGIHAALVSLGLIAA